MSVTCENWDTAHRYTIRNNNGMYAVVSDFGALLLELHVRNKNNTLTDVVLGYNNLSSYRINEPSLGGTIGRNANRIEGASFCLNGREYSLMANDNGNNLHSGLYGYQRRMWTVDDISEYRVTFKLISPDGDQGFPGNAIIYASYSLDNNDTLTIKYTATCNTDTIFNMTNHSYFNLDGLNVLTAMNHYLSIDADSYTITRSNGLPTGAICGVGSTPMDFRKLKCISDDIDKDYDALITAGGYDHNYILNHTEGKPDAVLISYNTGIVMELTTNQPGLQLYTANFLEDTHGKNDCALIRRNAVCLEPQQFPDAIHHSNFPSSVVRAEKSYEFNTSYHFSVTSSTN